MQSIDSRVPISSEHAGPSRYASTATGVWRPRLCRARLTTQVRLWRARQHRLAPRRGCARKPDIPSRLPGTIAPEPSASHMALETAANSATSTTSEPADGYIASSIPASGAAKKQYVPVPSVIATQEVFPQLRTLQPNKPVSLTPSASWLTPTLQTSASASTTRPLRLKVMVVAKSTGFDTSITARPHTNFLDQPSLALLAGTLSTSPI